MKRVNRFQWLIYKLFRKVWTPVFINNPYMIIAFSDFFNNWITSKYSKEEIAKLRKEMAHIKDNNQTIVDIRRI